MRYPLYCNSYWFKIMAVQIIGKISYGKANQLWLSIVFDYFLNLRKKQMIIIIILNVIYKWSESNAKTQNTSNRKIIYYIKELSQHKFYVQKKSLKTELLSTSLKKKKELISTSGMIRSIAQSTNIAEARKNQRRKPTCPLSYVGVGRKLRGIFFLCSVGAQKRRKKIKK